MATNDTNATPGGVSMLGPVQLIVVELDNDQQRGQITRTLHEVSRLGIIRVLDLLAIRKEENGDIVSLGASDLTEDQRAEYGAIVGALLGFGAGGEEGAQLGAIVGAERFAEHTFGLSDSDIQDIGRDLPAGKTLLVALYEHRWAEELRAALSQAGGRVVMQGLVTPESLLELGAILSYSESEASEGQAP